MSVKRTHWLYHAFAPIFTRKKHGSFFSPPLFILYQKPVFGGMKFQPFDSGIKVHESHGVAVPASNWEFKDLIKKKPTKIKQWLVGGSWLSLF